MNLKAYLAFNHLFFSIFLAFLASAYAACGHQCVSCLPGSGIFF